MIGVNQSSFCPWWNYFQSPGLGFRSNFLRNSRRISPLLAFRTNLSCPQGTGKNAVGFMDGLSPPPGISRWPWRSGDRLAARPDTTDCLSQTPSPPAARAVQAEPQRGFGGYLVQVQGGAEKGIVAEGFDGGKIRLAQTQQSDQCQAAGTGEKFIASFDVKKHRQTIPRRGG